MLKKNQAPKRLKLPRLTNSEYELAESMAAGIPLSQCPTCGSKQINVSPDHYGWENGTYRLDGKEYPCDCQTQMELRKHYLLANIGDQYQRLDWKDYAGSPQAKDAISLYLSSWETAKRNGMGLEFSSPNLGVGKTFAATHVAKELVKKGERVYFVHFRDIVSLYNKESNSKNIQESRLMDSTVLVLDEVVPAISFAQNQFFAEKFEELVRHRTNFNRVIIMTTNLDPDELDDEYPRTYSLLAAKQIRVKMTGVDARQGIREIRNLELLANNEVEPIT